MKKYLSVLVVTLFLLVCTTVYGQEDVESLASAMKVREKREDRIELLRRFSNKNQLKLLAMFKYIQHSLFQASLKRKPFLKTMNVIDLDLMLYYKEYMKTGEPTIDGFIEYLRLNLTDNYANVDGEEVIKELKMKLNSLEEEYTNIFKAIMPVDVIK